MNPKMIRGLVYLVSAVWLTSFVTSLVNSDYHPDASVNVAFTLVVGAALAVRKGGGDE